MIAGAALLLAAGCGKKIKNPNPNFGQPNRTANGFTTGALIHGAPTPTPPPTPAAFPKSTITLQIAKTMLLNPALLRDPEVGLPNPVPVPSSEGVPWDVDLQSHEKALQKQMEPILAPFTDEQHVTVKVHIREESDSPVFTAEDFPVPGELLKRLLQESPDTAVTQSVLNQFVMRQMELKKELSANDRNSREAAQTRLEQGVRELRSDPEKFLAGSKAAAVQVNLAKAFNLLLKDDQTMHLEAGAVTAEEELARRRTRLHGLYPGLIDPETSPAGKATATKLKRITERSKAGKAAVALLSNPDAVNLYSDKLLAVITSESNPILNGREINPGYSQLLGQSASRWDLGYLHITTSCLPYAWMLTGLAYDEGQTQQVSRTWATLFEPGAFLEGKSSSRMLTQARPATAPVSSNLQVRWLQDDAGAHLIGSAMVYLDSKLLRADALLDKAVQSRITRPEGDLTKARKSLAAYLAFQETDDNSSALAETLREALAFLHSDPEFAKASAVESAPYPPVQPQSIGNEPAAQLTVKSASNKESAVPEPPRASVEAAPPTSGLNQVPGPGGALQNQGRFSALLSRLQKISKTRPGPGERGDMEVDVQVLIEQRHTSAQDPEEHHLMNYLVSSVDRVDAYQPVRQAVELLLSYASFLPDLSQVEKGKFPPAYLRELATVVAAFNLLDRKAYQLGSQYKTFEDNPVAALSAPATAKGEAIVLQARGPDAVVARGLTEQNLSRSGKNPRSTIKFVFPDEGCLASSFHLAVLKQARNGLTPEKQQQPAPEAAALVSYLLRPDIAAKMSNLFSIATTEDAARTFVNRNLLNGPAYAYPEDLSRIGIYDADDTTRRTFRKLLPELLQRSKNYYRDPVKGAAAGAEGPLRPQSALGLQGEVPLEWLKF